MAWSQAYVAGTSPAARSRHTTTLVGTKLYVFGGGDDSRVYNDLYVLDTGNQYNLTFSTPFTSSYCNG
jgi:N-acetylneuraminic acid mutarotase